MITDEEYILPVSFPEFAVDETYEDIVIPQKSEDIISEDEFSNDDNSQQDEFDAPHSSENELLLNKMYISALNELSRRISTALNKLKENNMRIEKRIKEINETKDKTRTRRNWYNLFGSPYFKDKTFFPCFANEDFYEKKSRNEVNYYELPPVQKWKISDQTKLENAVRCNLIEIKRKELKNERFAIMKKLKNESITSVEKTHLNSELQCLDRTSLCIEKWTTDSLLKDNTKELDWLRISVVDFDGHRSSEELQAMWELCLHPSLCRKIWTHQENEKLMNIVLKNDVEDWDQIALELDTKRSGFQCFVQYQRNLSKNLRKSKWTEEEDDNLRKIIQECRIGDYIPWFKVALRMNGRTKVQVYNRWTYSIDPMIRKGRFTPEEDLLIVAGVQRYGRDFPRISRFLPGRTSIQIRDRFIGGLQKVGPIDRWTRDEDELLMELVNRYGTKSWSRIATHFNGRYKTQVRHRYLNLRRLLMKYPELTLQYAPTRYIGEYCNSKSNLWSQVQSMLKSSLKKRDKFFEEKGVREDNLQLLKKKLNMINPKRCGRKAGLRKPLTPAVMELMKHAKSTYITRGGRSKSTFDEEGHHRRQYIMGLTLHLFNARMVFPFESKVIEKDDFLDAADKYVLMSFKNIYDERMKQDEALKIDSIGASKAILGASGRNDENWIPLYFPEDEMPFISPGYVPPSIGTLIGYRTAYASYHILNEYRKTPKNEVIALPCWRPPNLKCGDKKVKRISYDTSKKTFRERLHTLFKWTTLLKHVRPEVHGNLFTKNMEHNNNNKTPVSNHPAKSLNNNCVHVVQKLESNKTILQAKKKIEAEDKKILKNIKPKLNGLNNREEIKNNKLKLPTKENKKIKSKRPATSPVRRSSRISKLQGNETSLL